MESIDLLNELSIIKKNLNEIQKGYEALQAKCERYDELYRLCFSNIAKLRARCHDNERMVSMGDNIRAIIEEVTNKMLAMPQPDNTGSKPYLVQSANEALSAEEGEKEEFADLQKHIMGGKGDEDRTDNLNQKEDKQ